MASIQVYLDNWFVRHVGSLKTAIRLVFGLVWAIDGALKFQPGFADSLSAYYIYQPAAGARH